MTGIVELPPVKKKLRNNPTAQTVTANALFPILLVIPAVRAFAMANPEACAAIQGLMNAAISFIREKLDPK